MQLKDWLKQEHGRQASLARHLGIKPPQVADWISYDKPIPVHHMSAIELFTGGTVTRQEMRPTDWQRIWPELATNSEQKPAPSHDSQALSAIAVQGVVNV